MHFRRSESRKGHDLVSVKDFLSFRSLKWFFHCVENEEGPADYVSGAYSGERRLAALAVPVRKTGSASGVFVLEEDFGGALFIAR